MLLRYYEGLSAAEVARRLGVPAGTVRWRVKRALAQLRDELDRAHGGDRQRWHALLLPIPRPQTPASPAPGHTQPVPKLPSVMKGAAIVSAKTKVVVVGVLAVAALAAVRLANRGSRHDAIASGGGLAATQGPAFGTTLRLVSGRASLVPVETPDPAGALRLEGQVIDEQENPIAGALVAIDSNPPTTVVTRADGGFVLEKLMPRLYRLEAHAGVLYAGPVATRVSRGCEPVVLRARPGHTVRVEVRADDDGRPVAGATVALRSALVWTERTDDRGAATFVGVGSSWLSLRAEAPGYAPAHRVLGGATAREQKIEVQLQRGAIVAGRVVTPQGAPIAGALVWATLTSEPFPAVDPRLDAVTTDAHGQWTLPALGAGTYRFEASHPDHAQGGTAPTTIDGRFARDDIAIALPDGGTVSGEVRRGDGTPVAAAQVRVAVKGGVSWRFMREAFTDADGRFRLRGLPRRALDLIAMHDEGSSAPSALDLGAGPPDRQVILTISIAGTIEGVVVDDARRPMPEAQVVAVPEGRSDVTAVHEWDVRGTPSFLSDAAGRFRFAGLPDGQYRVRAARPGAGPEVVWLHPGVLATPGAKNLTIVIPGNGSVTGRVEYATGGAPPHFSIEVGSFTETFSNATGSFTVEVPAARHDLLVSGPSFTTTRVEDVDVETETVRDVGVVKVARGRSLSGRVSQPDGTPVAGAAVAAGELLTGDGRRLNIPAEGHGVEETRSGDDGRFSMTGFDETPLVLVAERAGVGRSKSIVLPRSPSSAEVDLVLEPTGRLEGSVSRAGRPVPGMVIIANPRGETRSNFLVISGPDGRFDFDTLTAGAYRVTALIGEGGSRPKDMYSNSASVDAGGSGQVAIEIPTGPVTLAIDLKTEEGAPVPAATVLVMTGNTSAPNMEALRARAQEVPDGPAAFYLRDWRASSPAGLSIPGMTPGMYTMCAVAIPADPFQPLEMARAMAQMALRPALCKVGALTSSTALTLTIPAALLRSTDRPR